MGPKYHLVHSISYNLELEIVQEFQYMISVCNCVHFQLARICVDFKEMIPLLVTQQ